MSVSVGVEGLDAPLSMFWHADAAVQVAISTVEDEVQTEEVGVCESLKLERDDLCFDGQAFEVALDGALQWAARRVTADFTFVRVSDALLGLAMQGKSDFLSLQLELLSAEVDHGASEDDLSDRSGARGG